MSETLSRLQPIDTAEQYEQWLAIAPPYRHINFDEDTSEYNSPLHIGLHDAWRSTRLGTDSKEPLAQREYRDIPAMNQVLSLCTSMALQRAVYQHATYAWPERPFDNGFVYGAMEYTYSWYCQFLSKHPINDIVSMNDAEQHRFYAEQYAVTPASYKEVDRRMVAVAISTIEDDPRHHPWQALPDKVRLLASPEIQHAIRDGRAILSAIRNGTPYDPEAGFGRAVVHWQITPPSEARSVVPWPPKSTYADIRRRHGL